MRGIKSEDLDAIVDFLYCGEANVFQENLDSFLAIAEELKLKGLVGQIDAKEDKIHEQYTSLLPLQTKIKQDQKQPIDFKSVCTNQQLLTVDNRGHTLLWVYRQLIAMPYIALARQAWIYRNISVTIGRLRS